MSSSLPRRLSARESALLDSFLAQDFQGVEALRVQRQSVRVKELWRNLGGIVLLEVSDADAPRAAVTHAVPIETRVRDADPPQEVLLFVKDGLLDSIELVDYSGNEPVELPTAESVEVPTVNSAAARTRHSRSDRPAT